jgi:hypothetical protein
LSDNVISGAILAFLLALAWDMVKYRRDIGHRDRSKVAAIRTELEMNLKVVEHNQRQVIEEIEKLTHRKRLLNPLEPLETSFWTLVKLNPPRAVVASRDLQENLQQVARLTFKVQDTIHSRETFRTANHEAPSFYVMLDGYDKLLQRFQGELIEAVGDALSQLEPSPGPSFADDLGRMGREGREAARDPWVA